MGLDRARESSMHPGMDLNPFAHAPPSSRGAFPILLHPPPPSASLTLEDANPNENTNRPWVMSLFTAPTVISGRGNGGLVHDQGSSDAPLTPLPKINTRQLLVLSAVLLGGA